MSGLLRRLWTLLPRPRGDYELFDLAAVVAVAPFCWYVAATTSPVTAAALSWLTADVSKAWGWVLVVGGLVGIVCSLRHSWCRYGCGAIAFVCVLWVCVLLVGVVRYGLISPIGTATVFGFFARRASRIARGLTR